MIKKRIVRAGLILVAATGLSACGGDTVMKVEQPTRISKGLELKDLQKALDAGPPPRTSSSNRESMQRRRYWWLPYIVLEFDKNEILVDALGGDLTNPVWNYRADLSVESESSLRATSD